MTILEKIKFEEDWLSEVNLTKENIKIAFAGIRATVQEQQRQPCEDCISLNKLDDIITKAIDESENQTECQTLRWVLDVMSELPSVTPQIVTDFADKCKECGKILNDKLQARWIPIKTRPLTEEEKEHYISIGWSEDSLDFIYDCPLPDDGQEVLITDSHGYVEVDTFCSDDGCYFENNCDDGEVVAWMPLPVPYTESEDKE